MCACVRLCQCILKNWSLILTSRLLQVSCTFHTPAQVIHSGWGRCSHVGWWCSWPGHWFAEALPHHHCLVLSPDWAQSTQPGYRAASCSRHCTGRHFTRIQTHRNSDFVTGKKEQNPKTHCDTHWWRNAKRYLMTMMSDAGYEEMMSFSCVTFLVSSSISEMKRNWEIWLKQ